MTLLPIILLPVLLIFATACNFGCSSGYKVNRSQPVNSKVSDSGASGDVKQQDVRTEAMRTALKREDSKLNFEDLKGVSLSPTQSEMRYWVGFGLVVPRCFVLKREKDLHQARYVTIQDSTVTATSLTAPERGWEAFDQLLIDYKVTISH